MSVTKRLVKGTAVAWIQLAVTMLTQLIMAPIFLSYWSAEIYGRWLEVLATVGMLTSVEVAHQYYIGFELLRTGAERKARYSSLVKTGVRGALLIQAVQYLLIATYIIGRFDYNIARLLANWSWSGSEGVLLIVSAGTFSFMAVSGIWDRVLVSNGSYVRVSLWSLVYGVGGLIVPSLLLVFGAGILGVAIGYSAVVALLGGLRFITQRRLGRRYVDETVGLEWKLVGLNVFRSLLLMAKTFLESFQQQGIRLLVVALTSPALLVAFATTRTVSNVARQGLGTITGPLIPELMQFARKGEQQKCEVAFATVWLVVLGGLAPCVVLLQMLAPDFFELWTRGKVAFDSQLFAVLSVGVFMYAITQPAMALVAGNNLLSAQIAVTSISTLAMVVALYHWVPLLGIRGAAWALLIAEFCSAVGYVYYASRWLQEHGMHWPARSFAKICLGVVWVGVILAALVYFPGSKGLILLAGFGGIALLAKSYCSDLPTSVGTKIKQVILGRLGFVRGKFNRP